MEPRIPAGMPAPRIPRPSPLRPADENPQPSGRKHDLDTVGIAQQADQQSRSLVSRNRADSRHRIVVIHYRILSNWNVS